MERILETWTGIDATDEARKALALSLIPGVGPATYHRLIEAFGSAEAVFGAAAAELSAVCPQLKPEGLEAILAGPNVRAVRFQEETCQRLRVRIVSERSEAYPEPLRNLPHPPPFLFVAGTWRSEDRKAVALVGTRHPSAYGTRMARELAAGLGEAGWTVVSGLARGIDTLAHQAALSAKARTVAVLGSGLDWIYPPENVSLARHIAKQGCVISEFPMGMAPHATHFPRRNRLISALSLGTVVVEAGNDSGSLITADYALDQGREVFAVPGAVHSPGTFGTHKLIRQGAHLVERADDIIRLLRDGTSQAVPARRFSVEEIEAREADAEAAAAKTEAHRSLAKVDALDLPLFAKAAAGSPDFRAVAPGGAAACASAPEGNFPVTVSRMFPGAVADGNAGSEGQGPQDEPYHDEAYQSESYAPAEGGELPVLGNPASAARSTALESAAAELGEETAALLGVLGPEAQTLDEIAEKARRRPGCKDVAAHRLLAGLLELEMKGRVKRMPGALFRRA